MSNIVEFPEPKKDKENRVRSNFEKVKNLSKNDRKQIAENIGNISADLHKQRPKDFTTPLAAARKIFEEAWGKSEYELYWQKRTRLVRFSSDRAKKDISDHLTKTAAPYQRLIDAAAKLLKDENRVWRRALRGTSLYVRDDINLQIDDNCWAPIRTPVQKLIKDIFIQTEFSTVRNALALNSDGLMGPPGDEYLAEHNEMQRRIGVARRNANLPLNGPKDPATAFWPTVRFGALLKRTVRRVFTVPEDIQPYFAELFAQNLDVSSERRLALRHIESWFHSINAIFDGYKWTLPNLDFDGTLGWTERPFLRRRDIWLRLGLNGQNVVDLIVDPQMEERYSAEQLIPAWDEPFLPCSASIRRVVQDEDGSAAVWSWYDGDFSFHCHDLFDESDPIHIEGVGPLFWPRWVSAERYVPVRPMIGLVEGMDAEEWLDYWPLCGLQETPSHLHTGILHNSNLTFHPLVDTGSVGGSPPFEDGTLADFIVKGLKSSLSENLHRQADEIGNAVADYLCAIGQVNASNIVYLSKDVEHD